MGRTGKLFAHEWSGVTPDVMAIAKGIGGGFPIGACLATEKAAVGMVPGTHGSTFGGNPLAAAVGNAVLDVMLAPGFFDGVRETRRVPQGPARGARAKHPKLYAELRGTGLLLGLRCTPAVPAGDMVNRLQRGAAGAAGRRERDPRLAAADRRRGGARRGASASSSKAAVSFGLPRPPSDAMAEPEHFLDLDQVDPLTLRQILDLGWPKEERANGGHDRPLPARRWR